MNIGSRPTFGGDETSVEVHIINFEGNLYGHHVVVAVGERLRGEQKFTSSDALAEQMRQDVERAEQLFDIEKTREDEE
jgi:riboflavin kinase/FMN adenylyltransferase